ncbi:MAG TPA: hypothetical protein VGO04_06455 [Ensifer sp.]|jgi:hypothetical protein|uniref:hypothetical protein n=1 Tax=Ensifer sp. TaxID=1872086 RepID=UPI002E15FEE5|nr:hypothetical protein [Ensifer sp.]
MPDDPKLALAKKLTAARRMRMVHYLCDRHAEGDKLTPLIEQLENRFRLEGWKLPE